MSDFDDIGKLKHLPLEAIDSDEQIFKSEFIITSAAEFIHECDGRNWVPLIVKEVGDRYQVVSNQLVYAVVQKANLERVWCIVIDPEPKNIEQAKILAGEIPPKVNLSAASRDTILSALRYLIDEPGSALKGVDAVIAANRIASANRKTWSNFNPIITLKCGITKGKKLEALDKVFFLAKPIPTPPPPEAISIKKASREEIFMRLNYLSTYKLDGFEGIDVEKAADIIFASSKAKWKSLNPVSKLECGIDTAKVKTLKTVFTL